MRSRTRALWALLAALAVWLAISGQRQLARREFILDGVAMLAAAAGLYLLASVRLPFEQPQLWPDNHPVEADRSVPLLQGRGRRVALTLVAAFVVVAFLSLAKNRYTVRGVVFWWAAVLTFVAATVHVRRREFTLSMPSRASLEQVFRQATLTLRLRWSTLALVGLLALSVFLRVYRIEYTPAEVQSDQVEASEDVRSILSGNYMIFFPRNTGREGTQFYMTALLSLVFGYSFTTLKLTTALMGSLNVIPMYLLGKEVWNRRFGLLAAFILAISYWHILVSRIAWRIALAPLWTTATLYFLLRAFRTLRRNDFIMTGLCLGAGLYGYMSFRVTPLLVVVLFALKALVDRGPNWDWRRLASGLVVVVMASALIYLPMLRYMYDEPRMLWYRVLTRTTDLERPIGQEPLRVFAHNVRRALLMFNWTGDAAWPQSIPFRPALDYISGGLLLLGAAYFLYLLLVRRRPLALYIWVSAFIVLLPSTLAIAFPIENPSNIRAAGVIPLVVLVLTVPLYWVGQLLRRALRGGTGAVLVTVLGSVLLVQALQVNMHAYFVDYDAHYRRSSWNASDMAQVIRGFGDNFGSIHDAWIIGTPHWVDHRAVSVTLRDMTWNNLIMDLSQGEPLLQENRTRLFLYNPVNQEAEAWLFRRYPNGLLWRFQASLPDKDFNIFFAPAQR